MPKLTGQGSHQRVDAHHPQAKRRSSQPVAQQVNGLSAGSESIGINIGQRTEIPFDIDCVMTEAEKAFPLNSRRSIKALSPSLGCRLDEYRKQNEQSRRLTSPVRLAQAASDPATGRTQVQAAGDEADQIEVSRPGLHGRREEENGQHQAAMKRRPAG